MIFVPGARSGCPVPGVAGRDVSMPDGAASGEALPGTAETFIRCVPMENIVHLPASGPLVILTELLRQPPSALSTGCGSVSLSCPFPDGEKSQLPTSCSETSPFASVGVCGPDGTLTRIWDGQSRITPATTRTPITASRPTTTRDAHLPREMLVSEWLCTCAAASSCTSWSWSAVTPTPYFCL
ncbi:hypothetical protein TSOC111612_24290 [Tsukamurella ocularis]